MFINYFHVWMFSNNVYLEVVRITTLLEWLVGLDIILVREELECSRTSLAWVHYLDYFIVHHPQSFLCLSSIKLISLLHWISQHTIISLTRAGNSMRMVFSIGFDHCALFGLVHKFNTTILHYIVKAKHTRKQSHYWQRKIWIHLNYNALPLI